MKDAARLRHHRRQLAEGGQCRRQHHARGHLRPAAPEGCRRARLARRHRQARLRACRPGPERAPDHRDVERPSRVHVYRRRHRRHQHPADDARHRAGPRRRGTAAPTRPISASCRRAGSVTDGVAREPRLEAGQSAHAHDRLGQRHAAGPRDRLHAAAEDRRLAQRPGRRAEPLRHRDPGSRPRVPGEAQVHARSRRRASRIPTRPSTRSRRSASSSKARAPTRS